ncbi:MAG TPA: hypothetical protein VEH29_14815 [Acidimicrobiales bacterium]|nr:hypothetical protein [Acidimicrobiales bacterium]
MSLATLFGRGARRDEEALRTSLSGVEAALLERATRQAHASLEDARRDADHELQRTREVIALLVAQAREEGHAAAAQTVAATVSQARSDARGVVLAAERRAYAHLRAGAIEELARRAAGLTAASLDERLAPLARRRLGEGARIERPATTPALWPGMTVRAGSRRASISVEALVDHELGAMAAEVEQLWS